MQVLVLSRNKDKDGDEGWGQIQAFRQLKYDRMRRKLAGLPKMAALRSDSRGSQARKELHAFEKRVEEAKTRFASSLLTIPYLSHLTKRKM